MASRRSQLRHKRVHLGLAALWAALAVPTVLWWSDSILWVLLISVYANIASHWSAAEASDSGECERACCAG